MQIASAQLLEELNQLLQTSTNSVQQFKAFDPTILNYKKDAESWSVLECLEHLNLYGDYYIPEITHQIAASKNKPAKEIFKSGILGNYFANSMLVKDGKMTKMKSPKDKNPVHSKLGTEVIDRFLAQQESLKKLLQEAKQVDLQKTTCAISISKFVRLRLGDTFRFLIYHIDRHVKQAERAAGGSL
jgi:DinB superfamily